ncbi:hypothetical protein AGMMS49532_00440 [Endomicrobiia bacterium]|nr:hypothetical protein AGMMS49532_00440 [Endomicrobiia bacterium]
MTNFINSVNKLKNFGSFRDFSKGTSLPEFKQANLFYGCNASGKTTLTRVFSCLNNGRFVTPELEGCELEISVNDKAINIKNFSDSHIKNKIRVFNSDFIEDNLQLKEGQAKKLYAVIGKENIDIKNDITKLEEERKALKNDKDELNVSVELSQVKKQLDNHYTTIASEIKGTLNLKQNDYKKNHFESDYKNYKSSSPSPDKITDDEKRQAVYIFTSPQKSKIDQPYIEILKNIEEVVLSTNDFNNSIELLKNPIKRKTAELKEKVIKWIEEGSCIHQEDHSKCLFCGQKISDFYWDTRANEIKEIIKKDDDLLKWEKEFEENKNKINAFSEKINSYPIYHKLKNTDFFTEELFKAYQTNIEATGKQFNDFKEYFQTLKQKIKEKSEHKDREIYFDNVDNFIDVINELKQAITNTIKSIEQNNEYVSKSNSLKSESRKKVIYYYIQTKYKDLTKLEADIKVKTENELQDTQKVENIDKEIKDKKTLLSNLPQVIEKINVFLKIFLDTGLVLELENDSYFFKREINGQHKPAKNLSDGEKSLIAFLYFIASLESSTKNEKKNEIIVIDDPVSSFDSHNLFNIQELLTSSVIDYGQIFFLTHNFYFFAKIRDALEAKFKSQIKNNAEPQTPVEIFEIENRKDSGSMLKPANKYIKTHISEYMSLIEKLNGIYNRKDDEKDLSTGNLIRRVLEVFLSFKVPNKRNLYINFQSIAGNDNKYPGLLNMANAFSHTTEISSVTDANDFSYTAGRQEIRELFEFMKDNDEKHFNGLGIKLQDKAAN